jgi:hypothetical protein
MTRLHLATGIAAVLLMTPTVARTAALEHEIVLDPARVAIATEAGFAEVSAERSSREFRAGRPDLPWITESVIVPAGQRVARIEIVALETTALGSGEVRGAIVPRPGLGPIERTPIDASRLSQGGFLPEAPVELGLQGFVRGEAVAHLSVAPARWNPITRGIEAVTRVRVRLVLEPTDERPLLRERVGAWPGPRREAGPFLGLGTAGATLESGGPAREVGPFVPTQVPSVLGSPVAYLIITNEAMTPEFQRLADWKTQSGVPAVVRTMSFIRAQYPYGADDAERVRMFIKDAYTRWGIDWVLLGGDTEVVPTRNIWTTFYGGESIACDTYFSCLDGTWNADSDSLFGEGYFSASNTGDSTDLFPEVFIGRAPTTSLAEAKQFVDRSMQYVRDPVPDYQTQVLFFAEVLFPQNWSSGMGTSLDGAELVEEVLPFLQSNPSIHYQRLYENHLDIRWEPGALLESKQLVLDSLSRGYNIAVHVGHGFRNVMSVGDANLTNADALTLSNGDRLTNLYAINCTSNAIDFPCIGEAFLKAQNGGAVTNVGSTRFDFPTAGRAYQKEFFRLLYQDSVTAVGELQALQKLPFVGFSTFDGVHRWTQMTLLLLGDPELRIYTGLPRDLTVIHPGSIAASDTVFLVNVAIGGSPLAGAVVTAYRPGDEYSSVITDASGNASIPFRPDSEGELTLTVTGYDCKPYQSPIDILAAAGPVMVQGAPVVDDDGAGGTLGNDDGIFDTGETVDLLIPITNEGGGSANAVSATLSTTHPDVSVLSAVATYGTIGVSSTGAPAPAFRVATLPNVVDQLEVPFRLEILDGNGGHHVETFQMVLHAPEPFHLGHVVNDAGGNLNGRPDAGEAVGYTVTLKNLGTGVATTMTAVLRNHDGLATVTDSLSSFGNVASGSETTGDPFAFTVIDGAAKLELRVSDQDGLRLVRTLDLTYPGTPISLAGAGAASSIALTWARVMTPDLRGYNVFRGTQPGGPYVKVNPVPTFRTAYYLDAGLAPLTRYYYRVAAVDSSGNESTTSAEAAISTNPPTHSVFPIETDNNSPSSVAYDHAYQGYPVAIAAGSLKLHVFHPDGTSPVDADGSGTTFGDFSDLGTYFAPGPAIADVDNDGEVDFIAGAWNPNADVSALLADRLFVFDRDGEPKPGWPVQTRYSLWSSPSIGDLDGDGLMEIAVGTNGSEFLVYRSNGTEWSDGDANPATPGVFKALAGSTYNSGTASIVDLDGIGSNDIVYGAANGNLYAWRPDGSDLPGFPIAHGGPINASVAIGYLDGPSDTELDVVVAVGNNNLYAYTAAGVLRAGFPRAHSLSGVSRAPSPALADMNNDGFLDIVAASTNGRMYVIDRFGQVLPPFSAIPFSTLTSSATESSPVVADIDGDGLNDIVIGDDLNSLTAISGTGQILPGFPILLDSEVKATPAVCDCDGDGMSEIVAMTWGGKLFIWDYDFPFSPGGAAPWPQFHHDARRTGFTGSPVTVGVEGPVQPGRPVALEFAAPGPNPAWGQTSIAYAIPAEFEGVAYRIDVFDLNGRRVRTLDEGLARAGRHTAEWDLRDAGRRGVDAGVYFLHFSIGGKGLSRKVVVMR